VVGKVGFFGEGWYVIAMVRAFEISDYPVYGLVRRDGGAAQETAFHVPERRDKEEEGTPEGQTQTDEGENLGVHKHCGNKGDNAHQ